MLQIRMQADSGGDKSTVQLCDTYLAKKRLATPSPIVTIQHQAPQKRPE